MTKDSALKLALRSIRELIVDESDDAPALQGVRMRKLAAEKAIREALAQPEQEPVARSDAYDMIDRFLHNNLNSDADYAEYSKALDSIYTTPPQRKPLTERELMKCIAQAGCFGTVKMSFESGPYDIDRPTLNADKLCRAIEAAHGIKE